MAKWDDPEYIGAMLTNAFELAWMVPNQTEADAGVFVAQYMYDLGRKDERESTRSSGSSSTGDDHD